MIVGLHVISLSVDMKPNIFFCLLLSRAINLENIKTSKKVLKLFSFYKAIRFIQDTTCVLSKMLLINR